MHTGIHVGAKIDEQSLEPLTSAILRILEAKADQETIRMALNVLVEKMQVENVSISNVNIYGDGRVEDSTDQ